MPRGAGWVSDDEASAGSFARFVFRVGSGSPAAERSRAARNSLSWQTGPNRPELIPALATGHNRERSAVDPLLCAPARFAERRIDQGAGVLTTITRQAKFPCVASTGGWERKMPYKVILVGTDGSERANVAFREAMALAKLAGATLHVAHVIPPAVAAGFVDTRAGQIEVDRLRDEVKRVEKRILEEAQREGVTVTVHHPGSNDAADGLIDIAQTVDADLVVVGNRGMSGVKRFVLGSVPNKVSHQCSRSVLIVNTEPT
jgi:nucleotide-binding universal stress UspA family protein